MAGNTLLLVLVAVLALLVAGGLATVLALRARRDREQHQRQELEREQEREELLRAQEVMDLATSGVLALAATTVGRSSRPRETASWLLSRSWRTRCTAR